MPVLSESLLPGGACPHTIFYYGLGAVVLICCGVALRRASSSHPNPLPQHQQDEKSSYASINNLYEQDSWQEKHASPLPPLPTQPPPYASPSAYSMQGSSFTYYASPVEMDMNPQSYFDEPFLTEEPSSYASSTTSSSLNSNSLSDPSIVSSFASSTTYPPFSSLHAPPSYPPHLQNQQPLSTKSWFDSNPASFSSLPQPFFESPNSSYSSTGSLPRRRSYTKTTSTGGSVSGEIVTGDMWRRHTRVFGGGVCKACEESELKMKMVKLRSGGLVPPIEMEGSEEVAESAAPSS